MTPQEINAVKELTKAIQGLDRTLKEATKKPLQSAVFAQYVDGGGAEDNPEKPAEKKIPAYFMLGRDQIDFDEATAHGFAKITKTSIDIHMPRDYWPDLIRQVVAEGEPVAITLGLNHRAGVS